MKSDAEHNINIKINAVGIYGVHIIRGVVCVLVLRTCNEIRFLRIKSVILFVFKSENDVKYARSNWSFDRERNVALVGRLFPRGLTFVTTWLGKETHVTSFATRVFDVFKKRSFGSIRVFARVQTRRRKRRFARHRKTRLSVWKTKIYGILWRPAQVRRTD